MNTRRRVVRKWLEDESSISLSLSENEAFGLLNLSGKDFRFIERGSLGDQLCGMDSDEST